MELVYLWVEDYKNIKKQGFNFSPRFRCEYDEDNNELTIDENDDYIPNFFGKNINVTAIVGKNGSGKSSVLECLHVLFNDSLYEDEYEEYEFSKFGEYDCLNYDLYHGIKYLENNYILLAYKNNTIIYETSFESIKLPKKKIKKETVSFNSYFYTDKFKSKNKISEDDSRNYFSLHIENINKMMVEIKNIDFKISTFMYSPYKLNIKLLDLNDVVKNNCFIENETLNDFLNIHDRYHKFLIIWHLRNYGEDKYLFKNKDALSEKYFDETFELSEESIIYEQDFIKYFKKRILLLETLTLKEKNIYLNEFQYFFEFDFRDKLNRSFKQLSNGEKTIFGHLFNIYLFSQYIQSEFTFLLDEPELSLHPNWQKKYIKELYIFLNQLDKKFNIILTSHSPFLLSDIPKQNIIFLDKDEDGNCKVVDGLKEKKQTFGANIHTLLSDSFFMEDGLMGEFAKSKIDKTIKLLNQEHLNEDDLKYCEQIISIIGEPIVKNQLQRMLDSKRLKKVDEIDAIKKSMLAMQKRLDDLEK